jgi:hypothetical protein
MARLGEIIGVPDVTPVETAHADCVTYLAHAAPVDLIYFDAPWGGPDYYMIPALRLVLSGESLGSVVGRALAAAAALIVVKMPPNADLDEFEAAVCPRAAATFRYHDVLKPWGGKKGNIAFRLAFVRRKGDLGPSSRADAGVASLLALAGASLAGQEPAAVGQSPGSAGTSTHL